MTNPLTSLDELIWKQFEKVTQYAHKSYGWDKWDLARMTEDTGAMSLAGFGVYTGLHGVIDLTTRAPLNLGLGVGTLLLSYFFFHRNRRQNQQWQEQEMEVIKETGAGWQPMFFWHRPLLVFGWSGYFFNEAAEHLVYQKSKTPKFFTFLNSEEYNTLIGLSALCVGLATLSEVSAAYFRTQIMAPPSTKKPFWKTTYEGIRNKFKPRPQLEPAAAPAPQYATIDTLVT